MIDFESAIDACLQAAEPEAGLNDDVRGHLTAAAKALRAARELADCMHKGFLIWSNEHTGWWRPNAAGYTINVLAAGRYSIDKAAAIQREFIRGRRIGSHAPSEIMVPSEPVLKALAALAGLAGDRSGAPAVRAEEERRRTLAVLASALKAYAPDLCAELSRRWAQDAKGTDDFLAFLRSYQPDAKDI